MKSLRLSIILSAIMLTVTGLLFTGLAHAESTDRLNHNFMSKRAYQAPLENNKSTKADAEFEGATLVTEDESIVENKNARNLKQLKINSLSRRPYME
jgi:hypothetical protein